MASPPNGGESVRMSCGISRAAVSVVEATAGQSGAFAAGTGGQRSRRAATSRATEIGEIGPLGRQYCRRDAWRGATRRNAANATSNRWWTRY